MVSGPARISLERIERVAGYPTGVDGIGRGGQSASLYFRAENLPESLSIQGAVSIQLGCATRLEVMPSVQLFSAVAGAPLKGKLSLVLLSSGGQLGTLSPKSALDAAKGAARAGGRQVAGKLGVVGKQLESAIADLLEDAADKIFRRAQSRAPPNKLPPRAVQGPTAEHHVARHYGVRTDRYTLIHYYQSNEWELFDRQKDPQEMRSVYTDASYAAVLADLKTELTRLRTELKVPPKDDDL